MIVIEILLANFLLFGLIRLIADFNDRPSEFDPDVWSADPEERAANLKAKTAARKAGKPYVSPTQLARREAIYIAPRSAHMESPVKPAPQSDPPRRLVRCCPMHKPHWE